MKTNKSFKEAILRAPESTDENKQQQQEQLYHPDAATQPGAEQRDPINEKPRNVIESLHTLRELEYEVEKKKKKA